MVMWFPAVWFVASWMAPLAEVRGARPARVQGLSSYSVSPRNVASVSVPSAGPPSHSRAFDSV
eukprot:1538751-Lingulodinium_polyedra.AAC.1